MQSKRHHRDSKAGTHSEARGFRNRVSASDRIFVALAAACLAATLTARSIADNCVQPEDRWLEITLTVRAGNRGLLGCLIRDTDLNAHDPQDIWEHTPLHLAARYDRPAVAQYLIDRGANVDLTDAAGRTPLRVAIRYGANDAAAVLVLSDATIDRPDEDGKTPLFWAVAAGNATLVTLLLEHGADPSRTVMVDGQETSIREYAKKTHYKEVKRLLSADREPDK